MLENKNGWMHNFQSRLTFYMQLLELKINKEQFKMPERSLSQLLHFLQCLAEDHIVTLKLKVS